VYFINEHEIVVNKNLKLEPWQTYDQVIKLAMDFIKNCPVDESIGLPWYLAYSCFWTDPIRPAIWPDNPAGKFSWAVTTLLKYYPYCGDAAHVDIVRSMLDRLIDHRVPENLDWGNAPYSSAHPGTGVYFGARADGEYATEPDKVAQVGRALVDFYELTGDEKYLLAGRQCADVLEKHLSIGDEFHSPVPFRVNVQDGGVIEAYTADMIPLVRLFDELIRLGLPEYVSSRDQVMDWILKYPVKNNLWKGYFEDIRLDPDNHNRDQLSALETARYLIHNNYADPNWSVTVPGLIDWVKETFGAPPFFSSIPIHEQKYCYFVMGSHTARFASLCAQWYEISGIEDYREMAIRSLNWATYMANSNGTVTVGVDRPDYYNQCWFTDGYFDFVPHFIDVMSSIPEMAPTDSDHMLRTTTVIREMKYRSKHVSYQSFDEKGQQLLKLSFRPTQILNHGKSLPCLDAPGGQIGWYFDTNSQLLTVKHLHSDVTIIGESLGA
jgi:hypothetical protein